MASKEICHPKKWLSCRKSSLEIKLESVAAAFGWYHPNSQKHYGHVRKWPSQTFSLPVTGLGEGQKMSRCPLRARCSQNKHSPKIRTPSFDSGPRHGAQAWKDSTLGDVWGKNVWESAAPINLDLEEICLSTRWLSKSFLFILFGVCCCYCCSIHVMIWNFEIIEVVLKCTVGRNQSPALGFCEEGF